MVMDAFEERSGSNDQRRIPGGKRNKRQRPLSPVGRAAVTSCSSSGGESGCSEVGRRDGEGVHLYSLIPSSTANSDISTSTEEDEDMANCLILLAQGGCIKQEEVKMEKLISSRRFNEMVTTTTGKAGFYVYECKTCNRTFPSFQALGGHRASHKRPKAMVEEKKSIDAISDDHHEEEEDDGGHFYRLSELPMTMELSNKGNHKPKIHECSICGSEFSSGQALGGHMRRHRNPTSSKVTNTDTSPIESEKPRNIFPLDLNLPAPEDDHRDLKFQLADNQQHLLFLAPALVDCHY